MRRTVPFVLAILVAACSHPTGSSISRVDLIVTPEQIAAGDSLSLTLVNRSEVTVEYSFCPTSLERRAEVGWSAVQQPFGIPEGSRIMCMGMAYALLPGGTAEYRQLVTEDVQGGLYRLRMNVTAGDSRSPLYSSEFRVIH